MSKILGLDFNQFKLFNNNNNLVKKEKVQRSSKQPSWLKALSNKIKRAVNNYISQKRAKPNLQKAMQIDVPKNIEVPKLDVPNKFDVPVIKSSAQIANDYLKSKRYEPKEPEHRFNPLDEDRFLDDYVDNLISAGPRAHKKSGTVEDTTRVKVPDGPIISEEFANTAMSKEDTKVQVPVGPIIFDVFTNKDITDMVKKRLDELFKTEMHVSSIVERVELEFLQDHENNKVALLADKILQERPKETDNTSEFGYDDSIYDAVPVLQPENRGKDPDNTSEFGSDDSIYDSVTVLQTENRGEVPDNISEKTSNASLYDQGSENPVSERADMVGSLGVKTASV